MRRPAVLFVLVLLLAAATACGADDGPTRVLLVGDSVMNQVAPPLAHDLPDDDVRNESVYGSGLLTPDYLDWPAQLRTLLDRYHPDVVVFLFVGNYELGTGEHYTTADGHEIDNRQDPAFFRAWQAQAQRMTDQADADADVVWVLPPPMAHADDQAVVEGLREDYEDLDTATVDANEALADDQGDFLAEARDGTPLRDPDGVHLAPEGARRLARLIADSVH